MKPLLLTTCILLACTTAYSQATVVFQYPLSEAGKTKSYNIPLANGRFLIHNTAKTTVDKKGKTTLKIDLKKPGIIYCGSLNIYVEPTASMIVDMRDQPKVSGSFAAENKMMNAWAEKGSSWALKSKDRPASMLAMDKLTEPGAVFAMKDSLIRAATDQVMMLPDSSNEISMAFAEFIQNEITAYYNEVAFMSIYFRLGTYTSSPVPADASIIESGWGLVLREVVSDLYGAVIGSQNSVTNFNGWFDIMVRYHVDFLKENSIVAPEGTFEGFLTNMFAEAVPKAIDENLERENQEFFIPNYLSYYITGNTTFYTTDMLNMYNAFKKKFPKSSYISPLQPKMAIVKKEVDVIIAKNPQIHIIRNFETINTYDALITPYKGKVVLIDIWAMWCGPCIQEFMSIGPLQELKKSRDDFEILYISRDYASQEQRWEQFIMKRNLIGEHLIPNETLLEDLRGRIGWNAIPRYAIVNRSGELVNLDAPAPSTGKIVDLIKEELNKSR